MHHLALLKYKKTSVIYTLLSIVLYSVFAYNLVRTDHFYLLTVYAILFFFFYKLIENNKNNIRFLTLITFIFRGIFILAIPNLSQDFYRFIWDGRIILEGLNPYLYTPESFISKAEFPIVQAQELYAGMGGLNASHFTNYPPINQLCFTIAGVFAGKSIIGSVVVLRILIVAADFGTLYFGKKLLKKLQLPTYTIFLYLLNPFILVELTGNLHFEGVMIFFLVWSIYLLHINKWKTAAIIFAFSIATKLVPLMFLPLFFWWFISTQNRLSIGKSKSQKKQITPFKNVKKLAVFYIIIIAVTLLLFTPFFSIQFVNNYSKTISLWFGNFEFNASIYYIARAIGYWFRGWNEIAIIGKIFPLLTVLFVLYLSFFKKNTTTKQLIKSMLFVFTFYLFTSTTVHPWYVSTLIILSVFTSYRFALVWSFIIILSYLAYVNTNNNENLWIIGFEYFIIYGFFIWDVFYKKSKSFKS